MIRRNLSKLFKMQYVKLPEANIHQKKRIKIFKRYKPILLAASVLIFIGLLISFFRGSASVFQFAFPTAGLKSSEDKINVLLLGDAGGSHDGAYLTDSMMVASFNPKTKSAYFISIPRDLWLDQYKMKANAVYETGMNRGEGIKFTKEVVGQILGIPIHYGIRLDFSGFEKAIDDLGGVDVNVLNTFDDYLYPITGKEDDLCGFTEVERDFSPDEAKTLNIEPGKKKVFVSPDGKIATDSADEDKGFKYFSCRFEHIHFEKGLTHMDGATALKFVRSRHGTGTEDSDFARSARQQKVIEGFRKKVFSVETAVNPKRISGLMADFGQSFETDIPIDDMVRLYGLSKSIEKTGNFVINSTDTDSLLINPSPSDYGGAWVLVPKGGNFDAVHTYVDKILSGEVNNEATGSARISPSGVPKKTK